MIAFKGVDVECLLCRVERLRMFEFPTIFARRLLQLTEEVFCFWNDDFPAAYADEFFV